MKKNFIVVAVLLLSVQASPLLAKPKGAAAAVVGGQNHTVKRGETLFSIAEEYYGSGYEWMRLKEYNGWIEDPNKLNIGEIIYIPDAKGAPATFGRGQTSRDPGNGRPLIGWLPNLKGVTFFGKTVYQLILILMAWFIIHFTVEGLFVWFAAHLAFVKDVSIKKAMRATLQAESLAFICLVMVAVIGLMLLYVGTTSPGKPLGPELLGTAEQYIGTPSGMMLAGLLMVGLYGFLGIRFIPPAFGVQSGQGVAIVLIAILLPHLIGFYLIGHRMGVIS
jgi:hypothetical protein